MFRRLAIYALVLFACIAALKLYAKQLPDYGIEKWWKVLFINIPLHKNVKNISESDAHKNENKYLFLDARSPEEFAVSHIYNAKFIDSKNFNISSMDSIQKSTPLIVYCAVGIRSDVVAEKLMDAGFTDVHNLFGGIFEWLNNGYTIINNENKPTNEIHGDSRFFFFWKLKGERVY